MLDTELLPAAEADSKWLMVVLHGLGDSMEGYRWFPGIMENPKLNYLLVNAPDDYYGGFSWYDIYDNPAPGVERSRNLLFELLNQQREAGFATEHTFLFGFSQGCLMTLETGLRYPHRFAGLVGVSGYAHEPHQLVNELSPVVKEQAFLNDFGKHVHRLVTCPLQHHLPHRTKHSPYATSICFVSSGMHSVGRCLELCSQPWRVMTLGRKLVSS